jgi:hypothetical protein
VEEYGSFEKAALDNEAGSMIFVLRKAARTVEARVSQ